MKTKKCGCEKGVFACQSHAHPTHTPTPWEVGSEGRIVEIATKQTIGRVQGYEDQVKADAAFIVRAVNSHEFMLQWIKDMKSYITRIAEHKLHGPDDANIILETIIHGAKEVIAQAEGR